MAPWLIIATGVGYLWCAAEHLWIGNLGFSAMFLGYAFANMGLYIATL